MTNFTGCATPGVKTCTAAEMRTLHGLKFLAHGLGFFVKAPPSEHHFALFLPFQSCADGNRDRTMAEDRRTGFSTQERAEKSRSDRGIFDNQHVLGCFHLQAQPVHLPSGSLKIKTAVSAWEQLSATQSNWNNQRKVKYTYRCLRVTAHTRDDGGGGVCVFLCASNHASRLQH